MAWWDSVAKWYGENENWINSAVEIGGTLYANDQANKASDRQTNAQTGASQQQLQLSRDIYADQTARTEPWRQSGVNALNFLNSWNGLPQVATMGGNGLAPGGGSAAPTAPLANYGAGQPVAGHWAGGENGGGLSGAASGAAMGSAAGPWGALAGAAVGAFTRSDVDNWKTLATQSEQGYDWNEFFNRPENADLRAEFSKPDVQSLFNGNPEAYASWWKREFDGGNNEAGRIVNKTAATPGGTTPGTTGGTGTNGLATGGTPDVQTTIQNNPIYKAAVDGFTGVNGLGGDRQAIDGAYARGGKVMSGAQTKALHDRGTARASGAVNTIYGNYAGMAGVGSQTAAQQNTNATNMGVTSGAAIANRGDALASGYAQRAKNDAEMRNGLAKSVGGWF